ncbi:Major facilitator super domain-containing protein 7 [Chytridiales sp. JEL 0842]|nr:Major facilitator super domain-containing protein 7 [Chytridiales sp. JEL 0842]
MTTTTLDKIESAETLRVPADEGVQPGSDRQPETMDASINTEKVETFKWNNVGKQGQAAADGTTGNVEPDQFLVSSSPKPDEETNPVRSTRQHYKRYRLRYAIAVAVFLANAGNAAVFATYGSVTPTTADYYNTTKAQINFLAVAYLCVFIIFAFPGAWILDTYGLRPTILTGVGLSAFGALIRWLAGYLGGSKRFAILYVGELIAGLSQPLLIHIPTKAAALWFGEHERLTFNTIMSLGQPIGTALILGVAPVIVNSIPENLPMLNLVTFLISVGCAIPALFVYNTPKSPPSKSAQAPCLPFGAGLRYLLKTRAFFVLLGVFGIVIGAFNTYVTLISDYLVPSGYTEDDAGLAGILTVVVGIVSAAFSGPIVDRLRIQRLCRVLKVYTCITAVGTIIFFLGTYPNRHALLFTGASIIGLGGFPLMPICLELGVECTYPVAEGTSAGLLWMAAQLGGVVIVAVSNALRDKSGGNLQVGLYMLVGIMMVPCGLVFFYNSVNRRKLMEDDLSDFDPVEETKQKREEDHS